MAATVLIAFAESLSAPEVVWSLADHGFQVIALTRRGRPSAVRHSRFARVIEVTAPGYDAAQAAAEIKTICAELGKSSASIALMPLDDEAVWLFSQTDMGAHTVLAGPGGDQASLALDKHKQAHLAEAAGLSVPWTRQVEKPEEIRAEPVNFPVVFKPALAVTPVGRGLSKGRAWTCSDQQELDSAAEQWGGSCPMLLQQFISGTGEGIFGLATPRGILAWSGHRRLRMMNPHGSGSSACASVPSLDPAVKLAAERFVTSAGWRGMFMIELLRDTAGKVWFMELNGRSWGSMALSRRLGLEYPAWAARLAFEPDAAVNISNVGNDTLVCRHLGRELLHFLFVLRGPKSKALQGWPSIWRTLLDLCRLGSNQRWYNWRRDDWRVFFVDTWRTVWEQLCKPAPHP